MKVKIGFFKIFRIAGILSEWAETSLADGKIDADEIMALVKALLDILGVKAEIQIE